MRVTDGGPPPVGASPKMSSVLQSRRSSKAEFDQQKIGFTFTKSRQYAANHANCRNLTIAKLQPAPLRRCICNASKTGTGPAVNTQERLAKKRRRAGHDFQEREPGFHPPRDQTLMLARLVAAASRAFDRDPEAARELVAARQPVVGDRGPAPVPRPADRKAGALAGAARRRTSSTATATATCRSATWAAVRLSPSYFSHAFKESFGQSSQELHHRAPNHPGQAADADHARQPGPDRAGLRLRRPGAFLPILRRTGGPAAQPVRAAAARSARRPFRPGGLSMAPPPSCSGRAKPQI